jgi:hypothetical protein
VLAKLRVETAAVAAICLMGASAACAQYTYDYTGNVFQFYNGAYTSSDSVTGTFDLSSPINATTPCAYTYAVTGCGLIESFSIKDGVQMITSLTATTFGGYVQASGGTQTTINGWNFTADAGTYNTVGNYWSNQISTDGSEDSGYYYVGSTLYQGANISDHGLWAAAPPVPEPPTAWLALSGLGVLGLFMRRRGRLDSLDAIA